MPRRRKWQPTPVLLPGKFHGQRSLVGYSPWSHKESDTTEWLLFLSFLSTCVSLIFFPIFFFFFSINYWLLKTYQLSLEYFFHFSQKLISSIHVTLAPLIWQDIHININLRYHTASQHYIYYSVYIYTHTHTDLTLYIYIYQFSSVTQSCPTLWDPTPPAHQTSLSTTNSRSLLELIPIESVML